MKKRLPLLVLSVLLLVQSSFAREVPESLYFFLKGVRYGVTPILKSNTLVDICRFHIGFMTFHNVQESERSFRFFKSGLCLGCAALGLAGSAATNILFKKGYKKSAYGIAALTGLAIFQKIPLFSD